MMHVCAAGKGIEELDLHRMVSSPAEVEALAGVRSVDLSRNRLRRVDTLERMAALTVLDLSANQLTHIGRLPRTLQRLVAPHNQLTDIAAVVQLPQLVELDIAHNRIETLHLPARIPLRVLVADGNPIRSVEGIAGVLTLHILSLNDTDIGTLEEVSRLRGLPSLEGLSLLRAPVTAVNSYRADTIALLLALRALDGSPVVRGGARAQRVHLPAETIDTAVTAVTAHPELLPTQRTRGPSTTQIGHAAAFSPSHAAELERRNRHLQARLEGEMADRVAAEGRTRALEAQLQDAKRIIGEQLTRIAQLQAACDEHQDATVRLQKQCYRQAAELRYARDGALREREAMAADMERRKVQRLLEAQLGGGGAGAKVDPLAGRVAHKRRKTPVRGTALDTTVSSSVASHLKSLVVAEMPPRQS